MKNSRNRLAPMISAIALALFLPIAAAPAASADIAPSCVDSSVDTQRIPRGAGGPYRTMYFLHVENNCSTTESVRGLSGPFNFSRTTCMTLAPGEETISTGTLYYPNLFTC